MAITGQAITTPQGVSPENSRGVCVSALKFASLPTPSNRLSMGLKAITLMAERDGATNYPPSCAMISTSC